MNHPTVDVSNVTKRYGTVLALDRLSLQIEAGTVYGLLGPNGAGKTTLVRLLATLILPDTGQLRVVGLDVVKQAAAVRSKIGLAGQFAAVDDFLTGRETLHMIGALHHLSKTEASQRAAELLDTLSLTDAADRLAKTYSGGMRRRLDLAASLIVRPEVIFLDEPTTGLDPRTRLELWEVIRTLARDGSTVLLTTQYLEEADALAEYISVIDRGQVVASGTPSQLKDSLGRDVIEVMFAKSARVKGRTILAAVGRGEPTEDEMTGAFRIPAAAGNKSLLALAQALQKAGIEPAAISLHRPTLDDVFLAVTGHPTLPTAGAHEERTR
ncbi:ATP-binding cassette domain-containing protein [Candidatus Berkelbacteria bacterium]|nr:ATP-binding cassette domain-containing protein [Candidatus Berkelbacteria bacterium]